MSDLRTIGTPARHQIAAALRAAAAKLMAGAGEMDSFVQSYNFGKTKSMDQTQASQFAQHLDRVVAEFDQMHPSSGFDTDEMFSMKDRLDTAQKTAKMAAKASDPKTAARLAHRAYSTVADISLRLMNLARRSR